MLKISRPVNSPRFISQKDKYNCGPIAVLNYWKLCGIPVTYQDLRPISQILKSKDSPKGTQPFYMEKVVRSKWQRIGWKSFEKWLRLEGCAIIWQGSHYWFVPSLITDGHKVYVLGINYLSGVTYTRLTINEMKKILKSSYVNGQTKVLLIENK